MLSFTSYFYQIGRRERRALLVDYSKAKSLCQTRKEARQVFDKHSDRLTSEYEVDFYKIFLLVMQLLSIASAIMLLSSVRWFAALLPQFDGTFTKVHDVSSSYFILALIFNLLINPVFAFLLAFGFISGKVIFSEYKWHWLVLLVQGIVTVVSWKCATVFFNSLFTHF